MLANLAYAATLSLLLFVWIEGGRAHWTLMLQHDARVNPLQHDRCALRAGLAQRHPLATAVYLLFVVLWPAWIAVGFVAALSGKSHNRWR